MMTFSFTNSENVNLSVACPGVSCSPTSAAFPSEGWGRLTHLPNTTIKHLHLAITHQEVKRCLLPWRCGSCSGLASTDTCHCQACTPACCSGMSCLWPKLQRWPDQWSIKMGISNMKASHKSMFYLILKENCFWNNNIELMIVLICASDHSVVSPECMKCNAITLNDIQRMSLIESPWLFSYHFWSSNLYIHIKDTHSGSPVGRMTSVTPWFWHWLIWGGHFWFWVKYFNSCFWCSHTLPRSNYYGVCHLALIRRCSGYFSGN